MRFLILGGTGPSGIALIRKTLATYTSSQIIVYARSPEKIPEDLANNSFVTVVKGSLEELDKVETVVKDVDVIVSALGPTASHPANTPIATFYGHLINLLHKYSINRILVLGTASFHDPNDKYSWKFASMVASVKLLANNAYKEIVAIGTVITTKGEDLDWTIIRVPILTQADTEGVIAGYVGDGKVGVMLARMAFAAFAIGEIEKKEWVKKSPLISNA